MSFADLGLSDELLRAVADSGYAEPTPIQKGAIPSVLMGKDLIGIAQTGTGKTAGFVLPMIDILHARPQPGAHAALADPRADARAGRAGRREFREIRQVPEALDGAADRRRADGRPGQSAGKGRRRADRHAGPADGPVRPRQDHAQRLQSAGHRRSRPHARHGLHPRHRGNLHQAAQAAADPAVLGDHAAADQEAGRQVPDRSQDASRRPGRRPPTSTSSSGWSRCAATRSARCCATSCAGEEFKNAIVFANRKTTVRELYTSLKRSGFAVGQIHGDMEQPARIAEFDRFKIGRDQHPRRFRRRRPRARRQRRQPRHQFRRSVAARRLHPPHRPHRPRRHDRHRHHSGHPRGPRGGRRRSRN